MRKCLMERVLFLLLAGSFALCQAQTLRLEHPVPVMTLGVFHFDYPNLDLVQTAEEDQVDVLQDPWQTEIAAIANAIRTFRPTIIAVERHPSRQHITDSLYTQYLAGTWSLGKNEIYQLGFRIAADLNLPKVYCVDDMGQPYGQTLEILSDNDRRAAFESYYLNSPYMQYSRARTQGREKVRSITDELLYLNHPEVIRKGLSFYLTHPFQYEEQPGDFAGVDFETGRWFNRNLRILRNVQRIATTPNDRILLIVGSEHLNLLNYFFEISAEYQLVSPLGYLEDL